MLTVGELFAGIGGFSLGLEATGGFKTIWQSEIDPYAQRVLARHWPGVPQLGDITRIDWRTVQRPDIVCGGFPCQPVSVAGSQLRQADERWLWPDFAKCLRILRPRYALIENVPGLFNGGIGDVIRDLASLWYDAEWVTIPAAAVGAPHLRERVWIIAYPYKEGFSGPITPRGSFEIGSAPEMWRTLAAKTRDDLTEILTEHSALPKPMLCGNDDGIPHWMDRVKALGNAIVPQIATWIGQRILDYEAQP